MIVLLSKKLPEDIMKPSRLIAFGILFGLTLFINGCDRKDFFNNYPNSNPPSPPHNITSLNGDNRVDIYWDYNYDHNVAGYNVYYSYSYLGKYTILGSTQTNHFTDYGASNGATYYYAVTAYDYNGLESDLSKDVIYNTPRPEGFNQAIFDFNVSPEIAGYDFSKYSVLPYNQLDTDIYFEFYQGKNYIDVWNDTDIRDMGLTNDIYDIPYAPKTGWVPVKGNDTFKYTEALIGHTYVVWTRDNHFAKVRISGISGSKMIFDWSYQLVQGNIELKRANASVQRNSGRSN
jgi:hypothetical protein